MATALTNPGTKAMIDRVKSIIVSDLKQICRDENLQVSGTKNLLQQRIINRIIELFEDADVRMPDLESLRQSIMLRSTNYSKTPLPTLTSSSDTTRAVYGNPVAGRIHGMASSSNGHRVGGFGLSSSPAYQFKSSPFFEIIETLGKPMELAAFPQHRNQVNMNITLTAQHVDRLKGDNSIRVLLYCAPKSELTAGMLADVAFPTQLEVKVNEEEVKANYKGVKNKPGSTRPADITAFIRRQVGFRNVVSTTYALTQKGFQMIAMLVKKRTVDELVERIRHGKVISKERVLHEMAMKANDPDIEVGSSIMTLKDPVSYCRIDVPCRSDICSHPQCFDAASFLQLQEQAPLWTCPICNKSFSFEALVVDRYFEDILQMTRESTDKVTVEPNGRWSETGPERRSTNGFHNAVKNESPDDSDDDLIEVIPPAKRQSFGGPGQHTPYSMAAPSPPRASSAAVSAAASAASGPRAGQKRKSEIIDLTLSDDEDDEPPAKRPAYHTPNSLPDHGRAGRTNGYPSYPSQTANSLFRANGPLRFQIGNSQQSSNGTYHNDNSTSTSNHNNNNTPNPNQDFQSPNNPNLHYSSHHHTHQPSPLSGTLLAPINLTESPPHRPPSGFSAANMNFNQLRSNNMQTVTLPPLNFSNYGHSPNYGTSPLPSPQASTSSSSRPGDQQLNGYGAGASDQRNTLRHLADPFRRG